MRQIKFRVWDRIYLTFIPFDKYEIRFYKNELTFGKMVKNWNSYRIDEYFYESNQTLNQFTGLLDKNGREIWEGDIVQEGISRCEVLWGVTGWDPFEYCGGGELSPNQCEIIGNIYENPELIKK